MLRLASAKEQSFPVKAYICCSVSGHVAREHKRFSALFQRSAAWWDGIPAPPSGPGRTPTQASIRSRLRHVSAGCFNPFLNDQRRTTEPKQSVD